MAVHTTSPPEMLSTLADSRTWSARRRRPVCYAILLSPRGSARCGAAQCTMHRCGRFTEVTAPHLRRRRKRLRNPRGQAHRCPARRGLLQRPARERTPASLLNENRYRSTRFLPGIKDLRSETGYFSTRSKRATSVPVQNGLLQYPFKTATSVPVRRRNPTRPFFGGHVANTREPNWCDRNGAPAAARPIAV